MGRRLRAHSNQSTVEPKVGGNVLNRMARLGMPRRKTTADLFAHQRRAKSNRAGVLTNHAVQRHQLRFSRCGLNLV
jgi:hypothetical protein